MFAALERKMEEMKEKKKKNVLETNDKNKKMSEKYGASETLYVMQLTKSESEVEIYDAWLFVCLLVCLFFFF